jgi:membrane protease YdiL (CAAX protease family)
MPTGSTQSPGFLARSPIPGYFLLTFAISWLGALAVAAPHLLHHEALARITGILMFPAMLLGPCFSGVLVAYLVDGPAGERDLFFRMFSFAFAKRWLLFILLPPILVLGVLLVLTRLVSPAYSPNLFLLGVLFGVPAGVLEEIGWTGFAFPKMRSQIHFLPAAVLLGLLWSAWHLPVIDFLGVASPHGTYLFPFFLAFTLAMTAMRVLISWLYANTNSILLAQLLHISSTGALVIFGAAHVNASQETLWYAVYGSVLWLVVFLLLRTSSQELFSNYRRL